MCGFVLIHTHQNVKHNAMFLCLWFNYIVSVYVYRKVLQAAWGPQHNTSHKQETIVLLLIKIIVPLPNLIVYTAYTCIHGFVIINVVPLNYTEYLVHNKLVTAVLHFIYTVKTMLMLHNVVYLNFNDVYIYYNYVAILLLITI